MAQSTGTEIRAMVVAECVMINAKAASAALNKWMKEHVPAGCNMHGFCHLMRDRLRAVECPADIVDQIGGWQTDGVGYGYGSGTP